jgi:uncharacterized membrane protein YbhN (UPF0104 family)
VARDPSPQSHDQSDAFSLPPTRSLRSKFNPATAMSLITQNGVPDPESGTAAELDSDQGAAAITETPMPDELSSRHLRRRLIELALLFVAVGVFVLTGPDLGNLRTEIGRAAPAWLVLGVGLEVLSALSYVVIFRAVFCPRMSWGMSYQIGMAEQGANSVLSVSGVGGLALGAWALRRGGMSVEQIGRKSVAFFFLTSAANVTGVIGFAALYGVGVLQGDPDPILTYIAGGAAFAATLFVLALPRLFAGKPAEPPSPKGRVASALWFARYSLGQGISDAVLLVRRRSLGVLLGSLGTMVFDLAVLGASFRAFGASPPLGVLVLGYLIGQLGGNLPTPGGIGGVDLGLIGVFTLYHQPLASTTAAVLIYHAIALWVPALIGSIAFVQLRRTLQREREPAVICTPLAEPIEAVSA